MKLERTYPAEPAVRGWIFYDAACSSCVRGQRLTERIFQSRGFNWLPLQTPGTAARLGVRELAFEIRMHLLLADGRVFHNADAFGILCRRVWWLWPVGALLLVPGFREIGRWIYDWFACNRYRFGGACEIEWPRNDDVSRPALSLPIEKPLWPHAIPLVGLLLLAFAFARHLEPWVWMWTLAFALFFGCKWLTHATVLRRRVRPSLPRALGYLLMWPGMDAESFYKNEWLTLTPKRKEWIVAGTNIVFGTALVWIATPRILSVNELSAGWIGMTGAVLVLHFGWFKILSLAWQAAGVHATPLMRSPILAKSLGEFWSRRWNTAFHDLANRWAFNPIRRFVGPTAATLVAFALSGQTLFLYLPVVYAWAALKG